jgi:trans-aconitate 2-methyltransferase
MAQWNPTTYLQFSDERSRPFFDLVARVRAESPRRVVDLGCGPGQLTATLAERWPGAEVQGIDSSPAMIDRAAEHAGERLSFTVGDASSWHPTEPVDVLVSNATLQWVPGHRALLAGFVQALAPSGWLALQVPGNFEEPSHRLLRELAADPRFAPSTDGVEAPAAFDAATYLADLSALGCSVEAWETTYLHVLSGPDPVFRWISGTGARPVLQSLPDALRPTFEAEYRQLLRQAYPEQAFGTVLPFRRVFAVAHRQGPEVSVVRNDSASRFEGRIGDELVGVVDYHLSGSTVVITHTGTEPRWRGRGIAAVLTRAALDDAATRGQHVRPVCPYTASYIDQHPQYRDLLG